MSAEDRREEDSGIESRRFGTARGFVRAELIWPVIAVAILSLAVVVLTRMSGEVSIADVENALLNTPPSAIGVAIALTVIGFMGMAIYDVVGCQSVAPGKVPPRLAAFAGMTGYALSNALGFHVLVGGPVRYRIYASVGLDAADVGRIVGIAFGALWLGFAALLGLVLVFDPSGLPALQLVAPSADRIIGGIILVALAGFVVWVWRAKHKLAFGRWQIPLPGGPVTLLLLFVGVLDIAAAAGVLYVLLPADLSPGFAPFLALFTLALIAGSASHIPGGLGVVEATLLIGLGAAGRPDAIAALLLFRIIYYILPLGVAAIGLAAFESRRFHGPIVKGAQSAARTFRPFIARTLAGLVFAGGVILLLSGNLPKDEGRIDVLSDFVPIPFAQTSHLLASLIGLFLLIIARGLLNRMALARIVAIVLLIAAASFSLIKALDWEEAALLYATAVALFLAKDAFYRQGDWAGFRPGPRWLTLVLVTVISLSALGFFAFRTTEYQNDLWWDFTWNGDAPRFLRATLAIAAATAFVGIDTLMNRPVQARIGRVEIPDAVRTLLRDCPFTQPNIALLGDKRFMIAEDESAFLMYGISGRSWIVMGDPVGKPESGADLVWRFAEMADRAGARAVFYAVSPENLPLYLDLGLAILKTGEVARVDLETFTLSGKAKQNLRTALSRSEREGLVFEVVPASDVPPLLPELRSVSDAWLDMKKGQEKGFSLGRFDDAYMSNFDTAVMRLEGEILAFANLWRGAEKNELAIDLMRYRPDVSKVLMDALFAKLLVYGQTEGYKWFSLGAAPLAGLADHPLASTWNRVGTFIYRRGDEFYNFEGLRAYKQKFTPVWTPVYLAAPGGLELPRALLDVASLISGGRFGVFKRSILPSRPALDPRRKTRPLASGPVAPAPLQV
ncbi:MAG: bifunctional lysylphosphatidylglycerol flippase/synthetase MprF [Pseudomonadota bacterium]